MSVAGFRRDVPIDQARGDKDTLKLNELRTVLDASRPGRFLSRSVIGLMGDRLARERPALAWSMSLRRGGADVVAERASLTAAYPEAGPDLVVFLPGLCEDETAWNRHADGSPGIVAGRILRGELDG